VWDENEAALRAFLRCRRCWRLAPMGGIIGLDYAQVVAVLRAMRVKNLDEVLQDLDAMADAAIEVLNRKD